jgi:PLP dependent protein
MAELIASIDADRVRENLARVREEIAAAAARAGRDPAAVRVLAATKYVACDDLPKLAQAGVVLVGENRAQDLKEKHAAHGELFTWHFIGRLQSGRVPLILPRVSLVHSLAGESAREALERRRDVALPGLEVLIQVNIAREPSKAGVLPEELPRYLEDPPFPVVGLMTMPPLAADQEESRRWFAALRKLAEAHGLRELSMGTSQDYPVAVEEGATIVRLGTALYV